MRRGRGNGHSVLEFGGSGEDSFVAVVVTKLTGALLFILLLAMVIMALLPKATESLDQELANSTPSLESETAPLLIVSPERLPDAIAGRPYELAIATSGSPGPFSWSLDGLLPDGLVFDAESGVIQGTPLSGSSTREPLSVVVRVSDGVQGDARRLAIVVFEPDAPLAVADRVVKSLPTVSWQTWLEHGMGFLLLLLIHHAAISSIAALQRRATSFQDPGSPRSNRRFSVYRATVRLATISAMLLLGIWLWNHRSIDQHVDSTPDGATYPIMAIEPPRADQD